jgi:hypothetical protein
MALLVIDQGNSTGRLLRTTDKRRLGEGAIERKDGLVVLVRRQAEARSASKPGWQEVVHEC